MIDIYSRWKPIKEIYMNVFREQRTTCVDKMELDGIVTYPGKLFSSGKNLLWQTERMKYLCAHF